MTMTSTVQTVAVSNINPAAFDDGEALDVELIGQLLTREDGEQRFVIIGPNSNGDSDEKVVANTPNELIPVFLVMLGKFDMVDGALLEGATIRVLADLPSFEVDDAA